MVTYGIVVDVRVAVAVAAEAEAAAAAAVEVNTWSSSGSIFNNVFNQANTHT
jgi:hypothetical protein